MAALGIAYRVHEHEPVFTVEESAALHEAIPGAHTKNLFLKDAGGQFWLITVPAAARVDLKALPGAIGCKRVSFGSAADMERLLGITPGSVSPLAAINDETGVVRIVLDACFTKSARMNVHPLRNTATLGLSVEDLGCLLRHWNHEILFADIPEAEIA
jgi:Ala-tRNA(Pro) deacylase